MPARSEKYSQEFEVLDPTVPVPDHRGGKILADMNDMGGGRPGRTDSGGPGTRRVESGSPGA